jgi:hypothetical protein
MDLGKMKEYQVTIEEVVADSFIVYANSRGEAKDEVLRKYKGGELVLEPGNLVYKQISVTESSEHGSCFEGVDF